MLTIVFNRILLRVKVSGNFNKAVVSPPLLINSFVLLWKVYLYFFTAHYVND